MLRRPPGGIARPCIKYVDELGMRKYKFRLNRKTYLTGADVEKLKHIKEKPWLAGIEEERAGPKSKEGAASPGRQFCYAATLRLLERNYNT